MPTSMDRIEKSQRLGAPIHRAWQAIADSKAFGEWFGMEFTEPFAAGSAAKGRIRPTMCDDDIARHQAQYEGLTGELHIERMEAMHLFSYRWHPFALDPKVDYSAEPMTLVEFDLEATEGGTMLSLTESGFDALPPGRRTDAREANDQGWGAILPLLDAYLRARRA